MLIIFSFLNSFVSDECNEEDFDDWEEVSPASLINLFRNGGQPQPDPRFVILIIFKNWYYSDF
jgi:hypothetical protein